jgi:hypothetical protein
MLLALGDASSRRPSPDRPGQGWVTLWTRRRVGAGAGLIVEGTSVEWKSASVLAVGLVVASAVVALAPGWAWQGRAEKRLEALEKSQGQAEKRFERLEKSQEQVEKGLQRVDRSLQDVQKQLAPLAKAPPARWRVVDKVTEKDRFAGYIFIEDAETGNVYTAYYGNTIPEFRLALDAKKAPKKKD